MNDAVKGRPYQESRIEDEPILGPVLALPDGRFKRLTWLVSLEVLGNPALTSLIEEWGGAGLDMVSYVLARHRLTSGRLRAPALAGCGAAAAPDDPARSTNEGAAGLV